MKALRSRNFAKLSSSNSTRDAYWVTSISAGTPAGYCLSQMRSMLIPLCLFPACRDGSPRFGLYWFCAVLSKAPPAGKRLRMAGALLTEKTGPAGPGNSSAVGCGAGVLACGLGLAGLGSGFGRALGGRLRFGRLRDRLVGRGRRLLVGFRSRIRLGISMFAGFGAVAGILGFGVRLSRGVRVFRRDPRLLSVTPRRLLLDIRGHGGNQCGSGSGRAGIDRDWLG